MQEVEKLIDEKVTRIIPASGGCIAHSFFIETVSSKRYFYKKYNNTGVSAAEAKGLYEIASTQVFKVPSVVTVTDKSLILEHINTVNMEKSFFTEFGNALAKLHKFSVNYFGYETDNYIGDNIQRNGCFDDWAEFYSKQRIHYQCLLACKAGYIDSWLVSSIVHFVSDYLSSTAVKPSLLHGDLWSGNYLVGMGNIPVLIDPAIYYGHWEAELAMTKLFGGFPDEFYTAYYENNPPTDGYYIREDIYTLYHLLNHLNLFGKSYLSQVMSIINKYV